MGNNPFEKYGDPGKHMLRGESEIQSLRRIDERINHIVNKGRRRRILGWITVGAAAVVLLFVGSHFLFAPDLEDVAAKYFEPYPDYQTVVTRGEEDATNRIYQAYSAGDYTRAAELFGVVQTMTPVDSLYLGITYQGMGDWSGSREVLEPVQNTLPPEYRSAGRWYLALACLSTGDETRAKDLLEVLKNGNSEFNKKSADLLNAIQ